MKRVIVFLSAVEKCADFYCVVFELEAIEDPEERVTRYDDLVEAAYERGRAINYGVSFGVDDVIDPADSRQWISNAFGSVPPPPPREGKKRPNIDTW